MVAEPLQYRDDFATRPLDIVVRDHVGGQLTASFELAGCAREACTHVLAVVTAGAQAFFEELHRWGKDEKDDRFRIDLQDLLGALDLDLEEDVVALGGRGQRRPVEFAVELRPLEELARLDRLFKRRSIDVEVLIAVLTRTTLARRPAAAQPQGGISLDESSRQGSLADTTWTDQYDQQRLSGQELETVRRVAWDPDREYDVSSRSTHSS